jgi:ferrous iron transport protein B
VSEAVLSNPRSLAPVRTRDAAAAHTVLLLGNPNVGKTTLFNALTGQNERVGNYPGVTVERRAGHLRGVEVEVEIVDVPGAYSLSARSMEEQIALQAALGLFGNPKPSLAVVVVDAGQLVRNLYLVLQLVEFQVPVVVALSMLDEVRHNPPKADAVGAIFGVACLPINPKTNHGLAELKQEILERLSVSRLGDATVDYPLSARRDIDRIASSLPTSWRRNVEHDRAMGAWALLSCSNDDELDVPPDLRESCAEVDRDSKAAGRDLDLEIIGARFAYIEHNLRGVYEHDEPTQAPVDWTERIDAVLLHPGYGFGLFVAIMLIVFQSIFAWADPAIGWIETLVSTLQGTVRASVPSNFWTDLLVEGILGGVGNVLVFLPQILLLFFFVGLLEDSGYMARIAYLMDRVLRGVGLHGRAFVPMLSGMACAVPAVMATRTMERRRDRLLTMMVVPLMTCSARLPVYSLVIGALFPPSTVFGIVPVQGLLMLSMYLFSTLTTLGAAWCLGRTIIRGRNVPLLLELPRYRWPSLSSTLRAMWLRAREFLTEAGTVILGFTTIMWLLLSYPTPADEPPQAQPVENAATTDNSNVQDPGPSAIEVSLAGKLGHALEPLVAPLGFDWRLTIGVIGAFSAREVFVSTLALVYGLDGTDDEAMPLRERMRAEVRSNGRPAYPPLVGLSLMVFFALACQCMSTLAVVKRETQTWRWPFVMFAYMTALAYIASFVVYQGGKLLGFPG